MNTPPPIQILRDVFPGDVPVTNVPPIKRPKGSRREIMSVDRILWDGLPVETCGTVLSIKQVFTNLLITLLLILNIIHKFDILIRARKVILHKNLIHQRAIPHPNPLSII